MKKSEQEKNNIRNYFLSLAREYEKNEFFVAAAYLYKRYRPEKARRLYLRVAKKAERKGMLITAAEAYESAGMKNRAQELMKLSMPIKKRSKLPKELYGPIKKPLDKTIKKFLFATTKYEREGNFEKAKKYWIKTARYYEILGEHKFAALYYFRGGDLRSAKRLWAKSIRMKLYH
jgi:hypothetical protein